MATPATSVAWQITFKKLSITEQRTFSTSLATSVPKSVVTGLLGELRALGYVEVSAVLLVTLPA